MKMEMMMIWMLHYIVSVLQHLLANNHVDMLELRNAAWIAIKHAILSLNSGFATSQNHFVWVGPN